MPPPHRSQPLSKTTLPPTLKSLPPAVLFSDSPTPTKLVPNIRSLSWSPTGAHIATSTTAHIRIWNPDRPVVRASTELRNAHAGTPATVDKLAFCPVRDALLASTGADAAVRLWDLRAPAAPRPAAAAPLADPGLALAWHPAGTALVATTTDPRGKDDRVHALDVRRLHAADGSQSPLWTLSTSARCPPPARRLHGLAFSNSGRELFLTTADGPVRIVSFPQGEALHALAAHADASYAVAASPAGTCVAVGAADSLVTLWDTARWRCAHALAAQPGPVRDLAFSFDGAFLTAAAGIDARDAAPGLPVYHVDAAEVVHTLPTDHPVTLTAWHPFRYWLAYAGDSGGLRVLGAGSAI